MALKAKTKSGSQITETRLDGLLLVLLAVFCLSLVPLLVKFGLAAAADPLALLALRMVVAALTLWGFFAAFQPAMLRINQRGLLRCVVVAASNATGLLCYYAALTRIDISVAHVTFSLYPAIALILLAMRGEPLTRLSLARLILALLGVYLLVGPGGHVDFIGILLVIGTATFYALHMNLVQWYLGDYRSQTVAVYVVSSMAVMLSAVYSFRLGQWQSFSATGWLVIFVTGVVSTAVARLAMFAGIQRIGSGQTALLGSVETLLVVLWGIMFLGERLTLVQWLGGILIIASAVLVVKKDKIST